MRRLIIGAVLAVHGAIHLMGFLAYWKITEFEGLAYPTSLLGGLLGAPDGLVRALGVLWLIAAVGFMLGARALVTQRAWWWRALAAVTLLSLALSVLGWPEAQFGFVINVVILGCLLLDRWLTPAAGRPDGTQTHRHAEVA